MGIFIAIEAEEEDTRNTSEIKPTEFIRKFKKDLQLVSGLRGKFRESILKLQHIVRF